MSAKKNLNFSFFAIPGAVVFFNSVDASYPISATLRIMSASDSEGLCLTVSRSIEKLTFALYTSLKFLNPFSIPASQFTQDIPLIANCEVMESERTASLASEIFSGSGSDFSSCGSRVYPSSMIASVNLFMPVLVSSKVMVADRFS